MLPRNGGGAMGSVVRSGVCAETAWAMANARAAEVARGKTPKVGDIACCSLQKPSTLVDAYKRCNPPPSAERKSLQQICAAKCAASQLCYGTQPMPRPPFKLLAEDQQTQNKNKRSSDVGA